MEDGEKDFFLQGVKGRYECPSPWRFSKRNVSQVHGFILGFIPWENEK
jgi:hypothetical protein